MVDRQAHVAAVDGGPLVDHVDRVPERVDHPGLAAGLSRERLVELQLEPREALVVDARVAEDVRRDRALRIEAPLLGIEAEACRPRFSSSAAFAGSAFRST